MNMLVKNRQIYAIAEKITFGIYDKEEKWRIADKEDNIMYYMVDDAFELVADAVLPEDYADGKYFFENGEFVINPNWKPFVSEEERIAILEKTIEAQQEEITMLNDTLLEVLMG